MAEPIDFFGSNHVFHATPEMGPIVEGDVPVFMNGNETIQCWKLSSEDIARIAADGEIWVSTLSGLPFYPIKVSAEPLMSLRDPESGDLLPGYRTDLKAAPEAADGLKG